MQGVVECPDFGNYAGGVWGIVVAHYYFLFILEPVG
jgi:hypothetical protein